MSAIGFGQRVTGGGSSPTIINVTSGAHGGANTLRNALNQAKSLTATRIVIADNLTIAQDDDPLNIRAKNVTITGGTNSVISSSQLRIDCEEADNILLQNLKFKGTPASTTPPRDGIVIDATKGRNPMGVWIDHCEFQAYFDLNITLKAADIVSAPPLLITISNCLFHNDDPGGTNRENNGAIGIAGFQQDGSDSEVRRNRSINAYATVTGNVFRTVRRRSPRSSGLSVAHAFNNVLIRWGSGNQTNQTNGMESGHDGLLVAQANFFRAGDLKQTIDVAEAGAEGPAGQLIIDDSDVTLKNEYDNGALPTRASGSAFSIGRAYGLFGFTPPVVEAMNKTLRDRIKATAGLPSGTTTTATNDETDD